MGDTSKRNRTRYGNVPGTAAAALAFRIQPELRKRAGAVAGALGLSWQEVLTAALEEWTQRHVDTAIGVLRGEVSRG